MNAVHIQRSLMLAALLSLAVPGLDAQQLTLSGKECRVKTDLKARIGKPFVKRIDRYCMHFAEFFDGLGLDPRHNNKAIVRIFSRHEDFEEYTLRTTSLESAPAAYFSPSLNGIVSYHDETDPYIRQVLFHEMSHQYINRYSTNVPAWANEGLAEYFEGWLLTAEGDLVKKQPPFYDLLVVQKTLRKAKGDGGQDRTDTKTFETLSVRELIEMDRNDFMRFRENYPDQHRYLHYAMSWSLVYYFLEGPSEEDRARFTGFLKELNEKNDRAEPFRVEDWDALEERWGEYVLSLEVVPKAIDDYRILASSHREDKEYPQACAAYEKALELDPDIAGLRYWLGYCYKRRGDYEKAVEFLQQAREEEAADPRSLYQLARIVGKLDRENEEGDYDQALEYAREASKLRDDESAFYLSFVARCQHLSGDDRGAKKTMKKVLRLVRDEPEEVQERYEEMLREYSG